MPPSELPPTYRRTPGWVLPALLVAVLAVPLAEVWLLLKVGSWIGLLPTVALVVVLAIFGTWLSRHEGARAWRGLNEALNTGRLPAGELADAALILIGAVLLVFPGFFTDIVGLIFLLPFTRPFAKKLFGWAIAGQARRYAGGPGVVPFGPANRAENDEPRCGTGEVIEGEVVDDDPPEQR